LSLVQKEKQENCTWWALPTSPHFALEKDGWSWKSYRRFDYYW